MDQSFLTDHSVQVDLDNTKSDEVRLSMGVPQGSVLSPILFLLMTRDFPWAKTGLSTNGISIHMFADGILATYSYKNKNKAEKHLQNALDRINKWTKLWKLTLSATKSTVVTFSRKRSRNEPVLTLKVDGVQIPVNDKAKFLGIWFDEKLSWNYHIQHLATRLSQRLNLFKLLTSKRIHLNCQTLILLYKAIVRSIMEYSYVPLIGCSKTNSLKIERTQNCALRSILSSPHQLSAHSCGQILGSNLYKTEWNG